MVFAQKADPEARAALADAEPRPFWLDDPARPEAQPVLNASTSAELVIVGAGFTGLWTALLAREAAPAREIVLIEAGATASGATGRNGGFVAASLTHGFANGLARWPREMGTLTALGLANLDAIEATVTRLGIACDFVRSGELMTATAPYQATALRALSTQVEPYGETLTWLDHEQLQARLNSAVYVGAAYNTHGVAMVNPARLAWGLRRACLERGVRLYEHSPVLAIEEAGTALVVRTAQGQVRAAQVVLATNAFPPLLKRLEHYVVPVYDYVLMSEPLSAAQRAAVGWHAREGMSDTGNQFHYSQMTADGRILWGGYDAVYHGRAGFGAHLDQHPASFERLATHFFQAFPQLRGVRFTHAWGGAIDTCSRFSVFWGQAYAGRLVYALGYTGLGVGASRFGAQVMLDLLARRTTERTALEMARTKPLPFPPEPLRGAIIAATQWSLAQADLHEGRRNVWLRLLDSLGLGFDS